MPQTKYTDADLARFERKPLTVSIERPGRSDATTESFSPTEDASARIAQLLANAKGTLASANAFSQGIDQDVENAQEDASLRDQIEDLGTDIPSVTDTMATRLGRLGRRIVRPIPAAAEKAALVGSFLAPEVAVPSQAVIAAMSGKRLASGEDETPWQVGADIAGLVGGGTAALRGLRKLTGAGEVASDILPAGLRPRGKKVPQAALPEWGGPGPREPIPAGPSSLQRPLELGGREPRLALPPAGSIQQGASSRASELRLPAHETPQLTGRPERLGLPPAGSVQQPASSVLRGLRLAAGEKAPARLALPERTGGIDELAIPRPHRMPASSELPRKALPPSRANAGIESKPTYKPFNPANTTKRVVPKKGTGRQTTLAPEADIAFDRTGDLPGFEVVDEAGGLNASGESAASLEALSRAAGMTRRGEQFVVFDRAGRMRPLIGPEAVDYVARPGETYGVMGQNGFRILTDLGGKVR